MQRFISAPSFAVIVAFVFMFVPVGSLDAQTLGYSVSASPSAVFPCGRITVQWSAPAGHQTLYLSLYEVGGSYASWWNSLPNSTSGTVILEVRSSWSPGSYVFHLATRDPFGTPQAVSNPFTIQGEGRCSPYFVAFPGEVGPQDSITIRWENMPLLFGCWIGFYRVGTACTNVIRYSEFITNPSGTWNVVPPPAGWSSGVYEFRYYFLACGDYLVARSNPITVTATPSASITVKGKAMIRTKPGSPPLAVRDAQVGVAQRGTPGWIGEPVRTDATGDYAITLPSSALPGQYTVKAVLFFSGFAVTNYHYSDFAQTPVPNPSDPRAPDDDLTPLYRGENPRVDILFPQPVVLVHGLFGGVETWNEGEAILRLDPRHKANTPLGRKPPGWEENWTWPGPISHRGYIAWSVTYGNWPEYLIHSIEGNAGLLKTEIETKRGILDGFGLKDVPIDIVAHSMGGLVTRAYLNLRENPPPDQLVDRIIMLGTPNAGVAQLLLLSPELLVLPSLAQMLPFYTLSFFESMTMGTRGARFILIGCASDYSDVEPELLQLPIPEEDDLVVSKFSAHHAPGTYPVLLRDTTADLHMQLPTNVLGTLSFKLLPILETVR